MTWHNAPVPTTLFSFASACPHGWIEYIVSHYPGDSGVGGSTPQDPDTEVCDSRFWGVDVDMRHALAGLYDARKLEPWEIGRGVPHGATVIARVEPTPTGGIVLNTRWGVEGKPVYWLSEKTKEVAAEFPGPAGASVVMATCDDRPDFSGHQPAPKSGLGDMWRDVITWAKGMGAPESVIARMEARRELGIERYGQPLQAGDGRDTLRETIEETLDQMAYAEKLAQERQEATAAVLMIHERALRTLIALDKLVGVHG